ncbi:MAG TPA: CHAT domain-containing tetratricopeptide repeat protein [Thermoanaerobaculia bacterium]|nr:CHAT domain-containing tetratricopeptide repeat protein [Thermoanaerobaculia bacterium]
MLACGGARPDSEKEAEPPPVASTPAPPVPLPWSALTAGARHVEPLPSGRTRRYTFPLQKDQYLHLIVEQLGIDVAASIRDPAGELLLRVDSPNDDRGPEDLFLLAPATGRHLLEIESFGGTAADGKYEIRVEALREATKEDRTRAAAAGAYSRGRMLEREGGDARAAAAEFEESARLWRELGEEGGEAWALYWLGSLDCDDLDRRREGAETLARAVDLFGRVGDEWQQAIALKYLGKAWLDLGDFERAGRSHERALALWEKLKEPAEQAARLNDLAIVRRHQGRTHAAIDLNVRAIGIWQELGKWSELATTRTNLGLLYARLGESRLALNQYRQALELLGRRPDPEQRAVTLTKLGDVLLGLEGPGPALKHFREALELRRQEHDTRGQGVTLNSIGRAHLEANRPEEAVQAFLSAVEMFGRVDDKPAQAVALSNLGRAYERLGLSGRAREFYQQALALSAQEEIALFGLARATRAAGRLDEAERWIERALDTAEATRSQVWRPDLRSSYHSLQQEEYAFFIDLLAERHQREPERGHDARAFAVSERARARSLLDLLSASRQRPDPEELRRLDELSRRLNAHHLSLLATSTQGIVNERRDAELTALLEGLRQARAEAQGPRLPQGGPPLVSLRQAQTRLLDKKTLLLAYFLGEERSFLWAVTSSTVRFVTTLPGLRQIEDTARQTYKRMIESHRQTGEIAARQAAERLSRMILSPVADLLDRRRLVIVAPGALQTIPFAALPHPEVGGGGEPRPLIADHEIVSLPSASVLASLRARVGSRRSPSGLLAVLADPVFGPSLQRLRYTGSEAKAILALAGGEPVLAAFGPDANRELVRSGRLNRYRILHFATHGLVNDFYPELSSLALSTVDAAGRPVDGQLRAYEISDLELRSDLVVLSACRTGLGKEVGGEGLVGLTQAFLHAGAPRLVVSLWDVDDRATEELMKRFYTALLSEGLPPAEALRHAQTSLAREDRWRAPYHWAGFVLQGEWN